MCGEAAQNLIVRALGTRCVSVPAKSARLRKHLLHLCLHALSAGAELLDARAAAIWTFHRHASVLAAVVTHQPFTSGVEGQGRIAIGAAQHVSTIATEDIGCRPSSIEKEDGLLAVFQDSAQGFLQRATEHRAVACAQLLTHVNHPHRGKVNGLGRAPCGRIPAINAEPRGLLTKLLAVSKDSLRQGQQG